MSDTNSQESPILVWLTIAAFLAAMIAIFIFVPTEQTEGAVQRIMYFHIPAAWLAFFAFLSCFLVVFFFYGRRRESGIFML